MVSVLFSATGIAARRVQVAVRVRADPRVHPRRRNHQRADTRKGARISDAAALRIAVGERRSVPYAREARLGVGDVAKPGRPGRRHIDGIVAHRHITGHCTWSASTPNELCWELLQSESLVASQ